MSTSKATAKKGERFVVVGTKSWNRVHFEEIIRNFPGEWTFISDPTKLTREDLEKADPKYVFFLHWSYIVPPEITNRFECVCFHMTDVPYGRGGSPLQNLIVRGHRDTKLTALRMEQGIDTGPVYFKRDLTLSGSAHEIFVRASLLSCQMIGEMIESNPAPIPQSGEPTPFRRRKPSDSEISCPASLEKVYDHIRMLDAEGYPNAYFEKDGFRYEFSRAHLSDEDVVANVRITSVPRENS